MDHLTPPCGREWTDEEREEFYSPTETYDVYRGSTLLGTIKVRRGQNPTGEAVEIWGNPIRVARQ